MSVALRLFAQHLLRVSGLFLSGALAFAQTDIPDSSNKASAANATYGSAWDQPGNQAATASFHDWVHRYQTETGTVVRAQLVSEGIRLAKARRTAFARMIQTNPAAALASTVPLSVRR